MSEHYILTAEAKHSGISTNILRSAVMTMCKSDCLWQINFYTTCAKYTDMALERLITTEELLTLLNPLDATIFCRLLRCDPAMEKMSKIETYDDFKHSKCNGAIFCVDCGYFDVISSDMEELHEVKRSIGHEVDVMSICGDIMKERESFLI